MDITLSSNVASPHVLIGHDTYSSTGPSSHCQDNHQQAYLSADGLVEAVIVVVLSLEEEGRV